MNGPSLHRLTIVSFVFHLTFFLAVFFAIKQSNRFVMPSPYVVSLVGSDVRTEGKGETSSVSQTRSVPAAKENKTAAVEKTKVEKPQAVNKTVSKTDERHVSEQIAALEAKEKAVNMIKKRAELRNVISLKGSGEGRPASPQGAGAKGGGSPSGDYYAKVTKDIWQHWEWPSAVTDKTLEAIISIRIMKDGSVQVIGKEKSSGNALFDRSALRAITKASPVTPPAL